MDEQRELWRVKVLIGSVIAFIACTIYSWQEVRYLFLGHTVQGSIARTMVETYRSGRFSTEKQRVRVHYAFVEKAGAPRTAESIESVDWTPPANNLIDVQYIPGTGQSRLPGHEAYIALVGFFGTLAFLGWRAVAFWIDFKKYEAARKRSDAARANAYLR